MNIVVSTVFFLLAIFGLWIDDSAISPIVTVGSLVAAITFLVV